MLWLLVVVFGFRLTAGVGLCRHVEDYPVDTCLGSYKYQCDSGTPVGYWYNEGNCMGGVFTTWDSRVNYAEGLGYECDSSLPVCDSTNVTITYFKPNFTECTEKMGVWSVALITDMCLLRDNGTMAKWYSCNGSDFQIRETAYVGADSCDNLDTMTLAYDSSDDDCYQKVKLKCGATLIASTSTLTPSTTLLTTLTSTHDNSGGNGGSSNFLDAMMFVAIGIGGIVLFICGGFLGIKYNRKQGEDEKDGKTHIALVPRTPSRTDSAERCHRQQEGGNYDLTQSV